MDAFTDTEVEEIVFVKPTQVGGTECLLNMVGYVMDQDPSPSLATYPAETLAQSVSKNRIQPMILACNKLAEKYDEAKSQLLEIQMQGMFLALTGANSPSQLASRPIRFLFLDEVDKYPPRAGKEGDPIALARERTKTFAYNKKIFITSTPTYSSGPIWQEFTSCETQYYYMVPCPHCGKYQTLKLKQIKWPQEAVTASERKAAARYECEHCKGVIQDADKAEMLQKGEWRATKSGSRQKVGFHLNAIYSPWITFGDVAYNFTASEKEPDTLMNFVNSWLGEPWEQVTTTADDSKVLKHTSSYTQGVVPDEVMMITGGVDVQKSCCYYTIRGWGVNRRSWNIDHGCVDTFDEILQVMDRTYHDLNGKAHYINFVLMDSGDRTDEVYDFCYVNQGLFAPVKGSSNPIPARYNISKIEKQDSKAKGMRLIICDGSYYKDLIFNRINREDADAWYVYDGCDAEYAKQITSEHKKLAKVNGRDVWIWAKKSSSGDNHYLDCEVYCSCAADVIGAFELLQKENNEEQPPAAVHTEAAGQGGWIESGGDWL